MASNNIPPHFKTVLPMLFDPKRVRLQGPTAYGHHYHEFGEIFWLDKGRCRHVINGESIIMNVGDCVLIRPWDCHAFSGLDEKPFWVSNVCFQWFIYKDIAKRYFPLEYDIYGEKLPMPQSLTLDSNQLQWARSAFLELLQAPCSLFHIERYLINFFAKVLPLPKEPPLLGPEAPYWMQTAWHMMQEPRYFRGGIAAFQKLCGRSREHVSRKFRELTGQTLNKEITRLRVTHAASLLAGADSQIVDIAIECGFESLSYFYLCFRRQYGMSPLAYRKRTRRWMYPKVTA